MKKLAAILSLIFLAYSFLSAQEINADRSQVSFEIANTMANTATGTIKGMTGSIQFDPKDLASANFDVCIDVKTIDTGNSLRDSHLRGERFFEVETYPTICFRSREVVYENEVFIARGELSMHGVKKQIELPFFFDVEKEYFSGTLKVDRLEYEIGEKSTMMVGKVASLKIDCFLE